MRGARQHGQGIDHQQLRWHAVAILRRQQHDSGQLRRHRLKRHDSCRRWGDGIDRIGDGNMVGGNGQGNVIAGNNGLQLNVYLSGNTIQGNFIGCNQGGTQALGGGNGVLIQGAYNTLGGVNSGEGNVISGLQGGNGPPVVAIHGSGALNNPVEGNFIGTDITESNAIGNVGTGISIGFGASNNTVGGTTPGARNIISANSIDGIAMGGIGTDSNLVEGNYIGTDATGAMTPGLAISWTASTSTAA